MDGDVQNVIAGCGLCKQATMKQDQYPKLPTGVPQKSFDKIAIDLVGPLMKSYMGNVYILTMIDLFSRWPEAVGISNKKVEAVGLSPSRGNSCLDTHSLWRYSQIEVVSGFPMFFRISLVLGIPSM